MTVWSRYAPIIIRDKIRKFFEPAIDPARVERVFREFDESRGYRDYHAYCRTRLSRALTIVGPCPLIDAGFQLVEVMSAQAASEVLASTCSAQAESYLKRDSRKLKGYQIHEPKQIEALLAGALSPEVDTLGLSFFQSEYLVHWFTLSRTPPSRKPPSVSFQWHCDKGPLNHLKLMLFLNDATEHGGGTAFVDLTDSAQLARTGYLFARGRKRSGDLVQLSRLAAHELHAHQYSVRAGAGILFQPSRVLHSGITPTLGPRFVLTLCLLPSPVPWLEALRMNTLSDLTRDPLWHVHARELLQRMTAS